MNYSEGLYIWMSYIHENYSRHKDSLFHPDMEYEERKRFKGRRYCFIAAIIGPDMNVPEDERNEFQKAHLLSETLDTFHYSSSRKKQTKDYHGMFTHDYFIKWMEKLFRALSDRNINNTIIVMDNAKYHNKLPSEIPRKNNKKDQMMEYLDDKKVKYDSRESKQMIWEKVRKYVLKNSKPVVCEMALEEGHEVVYTPPYHSEFQPIELVWGIIKGEVRRTHDYGTTLKLH